MSYDHFLSNRLGEQGPERFQGGDSAVAGGMMKHHVFAVFLSVLICAPVPAKADLTGGIELYEWCAGKDTAENKALRKGFVLGAAEHFIVSEHEQGCYSAGKKDCIPEDATPARLVEIVVRWLEDNPYDRYFGAAPIVVTAIKEAFHCS